MKIRFLLLGTSLSLIPQTINAQCVATQDCATLGYTETSCSGGSGVKCPFGNKWACFKSESEIKGQLCTELGFTQTCSGTNQTGGVGKACNGKYAECTCATGYIWNDSSQKCEDATANCTIGALYYADGTCLNDYFSNKNLLGVVIYEKSGSESGWIMTVSPIQTGIAWSTETVDISGVLTTSSESSLTDIQASCTNTDVITTYGSISKYKAAWIAKNYSPTGTPSGKSWCLPSGGLLNNLNNSVNFAKVNAGITTARGTILGNVDKSGSYYNEYVWSSSEYSDGFVWSFYANTSGSFTMDYNYNPSLYGNPYGTVRPVMSF